MKRFEKEIIAMLEKLGYLNEKEPMYIQADGIWSAWIDRVITDEFRDYFLVTHSDEIASSEPSWE